MKASVQWINRYLQPAGLSAERVEELLTHAGFPIDAREALPSGDARLEVEVTSNRGDCLSHLGLAREIAARTGAALVPPKAAEPKRGEDVRGVLTLRNEAGPACPRFTAQVIRGCKVGPSPAWLREALESVGQRSINNVVDATNFLNFEYGQPCHAFDLAKLAGRTLVVRPARDGEMLTTLDGKKRTLKSDEIVVADAERAQSLAGVIGGADSEVSASTTDVVLELATWDPVAVRRAARRHQVKTDASHRYERYVDPRTLDEPARRAAALIAELSGGSLCTGMLDAGAPAAPLREVPLRPARCRDLLGVDTAPDQIASMLSKLGLVCVPSAGAIKCTIPAFRPDLEREVDLIEEVARLRGLDSIPIHERVTVKVLPPQASERAVREIGALLNGLGYFETVTFSFTTPKHAAPFTPPGATLLAVDDERRAGDGTLRPSVLPGLLECRRKNQDGGVPPGVRLYETAAVFADGAGGERRVLGLVADAPVAAGKPGTIDERQRAVRSVRGAVEAVCRVLGGSRVEVELVPGVPPIAGFDPGAAAEVRIAGRAAGWLGMIASPTQKLFDLAVPLAAAELDLAVLTGLKPPASKIEPLPAFPGIERDLSLVVEEATPWAKIRELVVASKLDKLEEVAFVGTYRGKPIAQGRKSVTLRMTFRDPARTLRHEEVDPQVAAVVAAAKSSLAAELRA